MLETTIAGSLPKPSWLAAPQMLWAPWRVEGEALAEAKRDATILMVKLQEDAGIDIVTDGEQARQHFVHGFLEQIDGVDFTRRVTMGIRNNRYEAQVPTVTGPLQRRGSIHGVEAAIAREHTRRRLKFTLPGPMTIVDTLADAYYGDRAALAMAFAELLNEEARELAAIGVDVIQFDEPAFNVYMEAVTEWGIAALERAAAGLACRTAVHICYGYGIKANIDWKAGLGGEWRQYEAIFPALAASHIDQVSVECAGSKVPTRAVGAARRQGDTARRDRCRTRTGRDRGRGCRDDRAGAALCSNGAPLPLHQLRNGADAPRNCGGQAASACGRGGVGARPPRLGQNAVGSGQFGLRGWGRGRVERRDPASCPPAIFLEAGGFEQIAELPG